MLRPTDLSCLKRQFVVKHVFGIGDDVKTGSHGQSRILLRYWYRELNFKILVNFIAILYDEKRAPVIGDCPCTNTNTVRQYCFLILLIMILNITRHNQFFTYCFKLNPLGQIYNRDDTLN